MSEFPNQLEAMQSLQHLNPVAEQHQANFVHEPAFADLVDIKAMSDFPSQDIQESLEFHAQAHPWLGPAVLAKDVQSSPQTQTGFVSLQSRQNSGHNVLAQV